ncbi:MAG: hypothetical protein AAF265_15775 [Pseudomonadota bacterium]
MSQQSIATQWTVRAGLAALRVMSWLPWRVQCFLGRCLGRALPLVIPKRDAVALANLEQAYPSLSAAERADLLADHRRELGISLFQIAVAWWSRDQRILKWTDIEGLEYLRAAGQRPIVLVGVHCTAMEWLARALGLFHKFAAVHRPFDHPVLDPVVSRGRLQATTELISKHSPKALIKHLRAGQNVYVAADQADTTSSAVTVTFLGQSVQANGSVARLARKYDAQVLPVHAVRRANGRFVVQVFPPLKFSGHDDQHDTQVLNQAFESMIALAPTQYFWVHRRFRGQVL